MNRGYGGAGRQLRPRYLLSIQYLRQSSFVDTTVSRSASQQRRDENCCSRPVSKNADRQPAWNIKLKTSMNVLEQRADGMPDFAAWDPAFHMESRAR
jgi:hypothetical protein